MLAGFILPTLLIANTISANPGRGIVGRMQSGLKAFIGPSDNVLRAVPDCTHHQVRISKSKGRDAFGLPATTDPRSNAALNRVAEYFAMASSFADSLFNKKQKQFSADQMQELCAFQRTLKPHFLADDNNPQGKLIKMVLQAETTALIGAFNGYYSALERLEKRAKKSNIRISDKFVVQFAAYKKSIESIPEPSATGSSAGSSASSQSSQRSLSVVNDPSHYLDCSGLTDAQLKAIRRENNLSSTTRPESTTAGEKLVLFFKGLVKYVDIVAKGKKDEKMKLYLCAYKGSLAPHWLDEETLAPTQLAMATFGDSIKPYVAALAKETKSQKGFNLKAAALGAYNNVKGVLTAKLLPQEQSSLDLDSSMCGSIVTQNSAVAAKKLLTGNYKIESMLLDFLERANTRLALILAGRISEVGPKSAFDASRLCSFRYVLRKYEALTSENIPTPKVVAAMIHADEFKPLMRNHLFLLQAQNKMIAVQRKGESKSVGNQIALIRTFMKSQQLSEF
jgi:hypothetical protein